jgi:hypothetical protein
MKVLTIYTDMPELGIEAGDSIVLGPDGRAMLSRDFPEATARKLYRMAGVDPEEAIRSAGGSLKLGTPVLARPRPELVN